MSDAKSITKILQNTVRKVVNTDSSAPSLRAARLKNASKHAYRLAVLNIEHRLLSSEDAEEEIAVAADNKEGVADGFSNKEKIKALQTELFSEAMSKAITTKNAKKKKNKNTNKRKHAGGGENEEGEDDVSVKRTMILRKEHSKEEKKERVASEIVREITLDANGRSHTVERERRVAVSVSQKETLASQVESHVTKIMSIVQSDELFLVAMRSGLARAFMDKERQLTQFLDLYDEWDRELYHCGDDADFDASNDIDHFLTVGSESYACTPYLLLPWHEIIEQTSMCPSGEDLVYITCLKISFAAYYGHCQNEVSVDDRIEKDMVYRNRIAFVSTKDALTSSITLLSHDSLTLQANLRLRIPKHNVDVVIKVHGADALFLRLLRDPLVDRMVRFTTDELAGDVRESLHNVDANVVNLVEHAPRRRMLL
jgi:hypothetical protein